MKQTFTDKNFNWIIIGISLIFSVITLINIFKGFEFFSSFLLRMVLALVSITALVSLFIDKFNGERFSRIFIIVYLIFPCVLTLNQFLTDLIFFEVNRLNLIQNPTFLLKLLSGISLLYFAIKFSKQQKTEHITDYAILIIGVGIFTILYVLTKTLEPNFIAPDFIIGYPMWKTIIKSIIGILILIIGLRINKIKTKFNRGLILTSV